MTNTIIPRPEYPRPQMVRKEWLNLNGEWEFEMDNGRSGKDREYFKRTELQGKIIVPYCPESKLSGVNHKDFMNAVWYRKEFVLPKTWDTVGKNRDRVLLHFGAVDYESQVWVNGLFAGSHKGGYTSFTFDITSLLKEGGNVIVLYAQDDVRSGLQPKGKQCNSYYSIWADYTRTTGVWQTVWLEKVPGTYISSFKMIPDPDNACVHISTGITGDLKNYRLEATALYNGKVVGQSTATVNGKNANQTLSVTEVHLWEAGRPELYDLKLTLSLNDVCMDTVEGYFGLRKVTFDNNAIFINNKPVFQRLVLDQGYYPDGIYTAPADQDLKRDIEISMGLGFNGARMHQKVFDPRYLYWADKLGYLVWGEHGSWGLDISSPMGLERFLPEWLEAVERDFNHPSIIGWCPFNETSENQDNEVLRITYQVTKALDKTRPVIDASGYVHVITDIFDIHDYEQDIVKFAQKYEPMKNGGERVVSHSHKQRYEGQPYFVSEYGGIMWDKAKTEDSGWGGYGSMPASREEFVARYRGLTDVLLSNPHICAFCYTQLYDVEQEVNGLYTYDRKPKFSPDIFKEINTQRAAIEE